MEGEVKVCMPRWENISLVYIARLSDLARLRLAYIDMPVQGSNWYRCVSKIEILALPWSQRCQYEFVRHYIFTAMVTT